MGKDLVKKKGREMGLMLLCEAILVSNASRYQAAFSLDGFSAHANT